MTRPTLGRIATVAALFGLATCAGCTSDGGEVQVFAARSLSRASVDLDDAFTSATGTEVIISAAGTPALVAQVEEGAPADVVATADEESMQRLVDAGAVEEPVTLAHNTLAIAVAEGNPLAIASLHDLARPELLVAVGAIGVPVGTYAMEAFAAAGVTPDVDTYEPDVASIVTKLVIGEADAGVVYVTDAAPGVELVAIPTEHNVVTEYLIAVARGAGGPGDARAFVDFATGPDGQAILARHGFLPA